MMKKSLSIKTIVAIGIGAALFIILTRFASIPTWIPNTNIETSYAVLSFMSLLYGPIAGFAIGFIGHFFSDIVMYGSPWISWVIATGVFGLIIGLISSKLKVDEGVFGKKELLIFNLTQIIANAFSWFLLAPALDILIYAEPANKVFTQGLVAGVSNMITVAVLGTILAAAYAKTRVKKGSLNKD